MPDDAAGAPRRLSATGFCTAKTANRRFFYFRQINQRSYQQYQQSQGRPSKNISSV
jgi:hypothetical protein